MQCVTNSDLMLRVISLLLALVAAALLLVGGVTTHWWSQSGDHAQWSMGLRGARLCQESGCATTSLGNLAWGELSIRSGVSSYAAAFLASGLLLAVAVAVLLRRAPTLLVRTMMAAVVGAALAGIVFVMAAPSDPAMGAGFSMYAYFAGVLAGVAAGVTALRTARV